MDLSAAFALLIVLLLVALVVVKAVLVVPPAQAWVVERIGRFHGIVDQGVHLVVPFLDQVVCRLDLREQWVRIRGIPMRTADRARISVHTVVGFQIVDAHAASYEIADPASAMEQLCLTTLRNAVAELHAGAAVEDPAESGEQLSTTLDDVLRSVAGRWGLRITEVEVGVQRIQDGG